MRNVLKRVSNIHRPTAESDIFLFATPRGGSTWFMEMIWSQPGFKYCSEPFNVRVPEVCRALGLDSFASLYGSEFEAKCADYVRAIRSNRCGFLNPNPLRKHHRFITNRMVFKVIHAGMDRIGWFEKQFNAKILHVVRHPIAVSLSREVFPLLEEFQKCPLREQFTEEQCRLADRISEGGGHLEKGVVAWCLHNAIPLRECRASWAVLSYEQGVLEPEKVIQYLCDKLSLPDPERMLRQSSKASAVLKKSSAERQELLKDKSGRERLISSWRQKVSQDTEAELFELVREFGVTVYAQGEDCPSDEVWL